MSGALVALGQASSVIGRAQGVVGQIGNIATSAARLAHSIDSLVNGASGGAGGALGIWAQNLQPASWNGIYFAVRQSTIRRGRRTVAHEFPYRDTVWVEDLGRGVRTLSFTGFLIGDDVFTQRAQMLAAVETAGAGQLVHPSLGTLTVSLTEFSAVENSEHGRVIDVELAFIDAGEDQPLNPFSLISTKGDVAGAAGDLEDGSLADYVFDITSAVQRGAAAVQSVVTTATAWAAVAQNLVGDATNVVGSVLGLAALVGNGVFFGRYSSGSLITYPPNLAPISQTLSVVAATEAATALVLSNAITQATAVAAAGAAFTQAMTTAPLTGASSASAVAQALLGACTNPADAIRLLSILAAFQPAPIVPASPLDEDLLAVQQATAALCRRAALASLAVAASTYQPSSYGDAVTVLGQVTGLLDAESLTAGDSDDDQSFIALCTLSALVTTDLISRAANLPQVVMVTRSMPLPALFLAYQLYQDASRTDELITRANPIHPAFMPLQFDALAS